MQPIDATDGDPADGRSGATAAAAGGGRGAASLRRIDLNLLVVFEAVVAETSVSRAAHRLHLTQPAMSHALARLREQIGDPILERQGRAMRASARALAMLPEVRALLQQAERLFRSASRFDPAVAQRHVQIGSTDYATVSVLAGAMSRIRREAPSLRITIHHVGRVDAPALLRSGQIDLVLGVLNNLTADLDTRPLRDEPYLCATAADRPPVRTQADYLAAEHLNVLTQGQSLGLIDESLALRGLSRRIMLTVAHFSAALSLLPGSALVLTAPAGLLRGPLAGKAVRVRKPPLPLPLFRTQMAWARRTEDDEGLRWLRARIAEPVDGPAGADPG